jgi:hypothetical protein
MDVPRFKMRDAETAAEFEYSPIGFKLGKSACTLCGQVIMQVSKDQAEAKYEMKWSVHSACRDKIVNMLDRQADPGGNRGKK